MVSEEEKEGEREGERETERKRERWAIVPMRELSW